MSYAGLFKRLVDLLMVCAALVLLSPLLVVAAVMILIEDGWPVLFIQERVGAGGKIFNIYKFRSMRVGTKMMTSAQASTDAVTRVGRLIRLTNVDELPQLINILKGDMSIVGPRPALASQNMLLKSRNTSGAAYLRPGLTGLAQVNAFDGMSEEEKGEWDAKYAERVSFIADVSIILQTVLYLFKRQPVY